MKKTKNVGIDLEALLSSNRRLNVFAWLVYGVFPLACLFGVKYLVSISKVQTPKEPNSLLFVLLAAGAVIPAIGMIITRHEIRKYRQGLSDSKEPWHLFLSISVFQMFMITISPAMGFIWSVFARNIQHYLYFLIITIVWSIICWPRKRAFDKLLSELNRGSSDTRSG